METAHTSRSTHDDLQLLWATPVFRRELSGMADVNARLEQAIDRRIEHAPGPQRSQYGGKRTSGNFFESDDRDIGVLRAAVAQGVADFVASIGRVVGDVTMSLSGTATVLQSGGYHAYHVHANSHVSGVYYVDPGAPDPGNRLSGALCLYDPRGGASAMYTSMLAFGEDHVVFPQAGTLLMFPAFLGHSVHPFTGAGRRVTVTFNAMLDE